MSNTPKTGYESEIQQMAQLGEMLRGRQHWIFVADQDSALPITWVARIFDLAVAGGPTKLRAKFLWNGVASDLYILAVPKDQVPRYAIDKIMAAIAAHDPGLDMSCGPLADDEDAILFCDEPMQEAVMGFVAHLENGSLKPHLPNVN